jgi:hypothetical protein
LGEIVDVSAAAGVAVILSNGTRNMKRSLKACGLWEQVGGPLVMHSTEEVFALLCEAPMLVPKYSQEASSFQLSENRGVEEEGAEMTGLEGLGKVTVEGRERKGKGRGGSSK